jgi:hypothetical protein
MGDPVTNIELDLRNDFDDKVPRVRDVDLGTKLGMAQPRDIRRVIEEHADFLKELGFLARRAQNHGGGKGRPALEYWLNKEQAQYVATQSKTELGKRTVLMLVKAFQAFESMMLERLPPFIRAEFANWNKTWRDELMIELCKLRGELFTGKHPRWCARMNSIIYECVLGKEIYAALKARNPRPSKGHNHHQLIDDTYREAFNKQLDAVMVLAASSCSLAELEDRLRLLFQKKPMQLPLWAAQQPSRPGLAKAAPKLAVVKSESA